MFKTIQRSAIALALLPAPVIAQSWPIKEADATYRDFTFGTGETLELKLHYATLGTPRRNASGEIDNAVMILHGTGGTGQQFLRPQFADELFGPGQPLDSAKYFIILPDNIGHGGSSKPSNGLRAGFPKYDYDDMVRAQHRLVTETLGIKHLQLILGTSMGCMHGFVWGTTYPGVAKRLAPFACNVNTIAGRNRWWRKMSIDAIKGDPVWQGGNYTSQPREGLRAYTYLSMIAGANPLALQAELPTREAAEAALDTALTSRLSGVDANDAIWQLDSSRHYNPDPLLGKITVPVLWINSADDFINPAGLGLAQKAAKRMQRARFILIQETTGTKGHGTHTWAKFWKKDLVRLLATK
jgi:homoserine O-acetyltransferase/O-succinyltransferase